MQIKLFSLVTAFELENKETELEEGWSWSKITTENSVSEFSRKIDTRLHRRDCFKRGSIKTS